MKETMIRVLAGLFAVALCAGCAAEVGEDVEMAAQPESVAAPAIAPAACRRVCETQCVRDRFGRRVCRRVCRTRCF
jgi:hypothetical protein